MKAVTILGARPQFIKASAVSRVFNQQGIAEILLHTGQHYDNNMSDIFFRELDIPVPKYNLGIGSGGHGKQTGEMLAKIEALLMQEKPDWVVIYGDTNSTLAGALAAAKLHIPIAHVEAGLRSFNRKMPEEINRIVADQLSNLLFAPTKQSVINLAKEGYADKKVRLVGDVMYDAAIYFADKALGQSKILSHYHLAAQQYALVTIHRAENTDDSVRLRAICKCLAELTNELDIVLPLHPRTRKMLTEFNLLQLLDHPRIKLIDPVGFIDMVMLEKNAKLIVTDSGGVQKEAYFYNVPCITLRDETEWVELVEAGFNKLISPLQLNQGTHKEIINFINHYPAKNSKNFYGQGNTAHLIVDALKNFQG